MFVEYINLYNTFCSEVNHILTGISASKVEYDFLIGVGFRVLSQIIVLLDTVPYDTHCCKVLCGYLVREIYKTCFNSAIY